MQEYETDYEEEINRLKKEIAKEKGRTSECQREIDRLRAVVRAYNRAEEKITKPDYEKLFEIWSYFDDEDCPAELKELCRSEFGVADSYSFKGFCAGFAAAAKILQEEE